MCHYIDEHLESTQPLLLHRHCINCHFSLTSMFKMQSFRGGECLRRAYRGIHPHRILFFISLACRDCMCDIPSCSLISPWESNTWACLEQFIIFCVFAYSRTTVLIYSWCVVFFYRCMCISKDVLNLFTSIAAAYERQLKASMNWENDWEWELTGCWVVYAAGKPHSITQID